MHIFIIPSEEFVPQHNHALGIFQYHQAKVISDTGNKVGIVSITQAYSIPMLMKAIFFKLLSKKTNNKTDSLSIREVVKLLYCKLLQLSSFITEDAINDIPVYRIEGFYYLPPNDYGNTFGWVKAGFTAFKSYIKQYGVPDIIHAHNAMYAGILANKIKAKYNIPYIITEHSTHFARGILTDNRLLAKMRIAYQNSTANYAVSIPFCHLLNKQFQNISFSYLPNVIDPYLESRVSKIPEKNRGTFTFLNIAELHPKKNQQLLIEAFALLREDTECADAKLLIVGTGVEKDNLEVLIKEKHLQKDVSLLGLLNREKLVEEIQSADCIVLSSDVETFGVVLIEAMLFGKPVISTRCGGPESFVTPDNGILVDTHNPQMLADAMKEMIANYNKYNPQSISTEALNEFGSKKFSERIIAIYQQVLDKESK